MSASTQEDILSFYRAGHHAQAFAMQLGLERGRLRAARARALDLGPGGAGEGMPLFACGTYRPRGRAAAAKPGAPDGADRSHSEAVLRLKRLRPGRPRPDGDACVAYFAGLLTRALRTFRSRGFFDAAGPVILSPLPGSAAGPLPFGLCRVVEAAQALAGPAFSVRPLVYRGEGVPKAHWDGRGRGFEAQVESLMPLRDASVEGRRVVLVDDVVSSGGTLRAAVALMELYNGARALGLALAKTEARLHDGSGAEIL